MVTIRVGPHNYSVIFKVEQVGRLGKRGIENVTHIACGIVGPESRIVALGNAFCSPKDEPDLQVGTKLALGRALARFTDSKHTRAQFWEAYTQAMAGELQQEQDITDALNQASEAMEAVIAFLNAQAEAPSFSFDLETPMRPLEDAGTPLNPMDVDQLVGYGAGV
jgi:hypothetical protein